ncbi:uncharacterized protein [Amphiura filiformis]|uniref:uncharacterized protein n=1 Tax=Amphiura filiformis TaxID=82378 RepID=UPI003B214D65
MTNKTDSLTVPEECINMTTLDLRFVSEDIIKDKYFYTKSEQLIVLILYPLLLMFGLTGNCAFLTVVARISSMRTITNVYLANLAVADILYILVQTYDILIKYLISTKVKNNPYWTDFGCIAAFGTLYVVHFTSVFLIVFVSKESHQIEFQLSTDKQGILMKIVRGLLVVNSVINPVVYSVTSPRYRQALIGVFICRKRSSTGALFVKNPRPRQLK